MYINKRDCTSLMIYNQKSDNNRKKLRLKRNLVLIIQQLTIMINCNRFVTIKILTSCTEIFDNLILLKKYKQKTGRIYCFRRRKTDKLHKKLSTLFLTMLCFWTIIAKSTKNCLRKSET